jgi:hypothetical protein
MEVKAAASEFGKARPRLYDELNSSHSTIHGDTDTAIAAGFVLINIAPTFVSPLKNPWTIGTLPTQVTQHRQPQNAQSIVDKMMELPRRSSLGIPGFDVLAITVFSFANDGTPVTVEHGQPAPQPGESMHYDSFLERLETIYATRFSGL